jgi:hypothetical protein
MILKILLTICAIIGITNGILSQPLDGPYTLGGSIPDFSTLQLCKAMPQALNY